MKPSARFALFSFALLPLLFVALYGVSMDPPLSAYANARSVAQSGVDSKIAVQDEGILQPLLSDSQTTASDEGLLVGPPRPVAAEPHQSDSQASNQPPSASFDADL